MPTDGSDDEKALLARHGRAEFCWSAARGLYLDYDAVNRRHSSVASLATFQKNGAMTR
jgi:hypothetical protein